MYQTEPTDIKRILELPYTDKFPRTQLLLSLCQMVEENYPIPLSGELAKKLVLTIKALLIILLLD